MKINCYFCHEDKEIHYSKGNIIDGVKIFICNDCRYIETECYNCKIKIKVKRIKLLNNKKVFCSNKCQTKFAIQKALINAHTPEACSLRTKVMKENETGFFNKETQQQATIKSHTSKCCKQRAKTQQINNTAIFSKESIEKRIAKDKEKNWEHQKLASVAAHTPEACSLRTKVMKENETAFGGKESQLKASIQGGKITAIKARKNGFPNLNIAPILSEKELSIIKLKCINIQNNVLNKPIIQDYINVINKISKDFNIFLNPKIYSCGRTNNSISFNENIGSLQLFRKDFKDIGYFCFIKFTQNNIISVIGMSGGYKVNKTGPENIFIPGPSTHNLMLKCNEIPNKEYTIVILLENCINSKICSNIEKIIGNEIIKYFSVINKYSHCY